MNGMDRDFHVDTFPEEDAIDCCILVDFTVYSANTNEVCTKNESQDINRNLKVLYRPNVFKIVSTNDFILPYQVIKCIIGFLTLKVISVLIMNDDCTELVKPILRH